MRYSITRENEMDYRCLARDHQRIRVTEKLLHDQYQRRKQGLPVDEIGYEILQARMRRLTLETSAREARLYDRLRRERMRMLEIHQLLNPLEEHHESAKTG